MKLKNIIKTGMIGSLALLMAACSNGDQSWSGSEPDGTEDSSGRSSRSPLFLESKSIRTS